MLSNNLQHLILVPLFVAFPVVLSHEHYKWEIPNGHKEIYGSYAIGHTDPEGCSQINWFGMDFAGHGYRWTEALCRLDSDGDGQTNGFELGDPQCTWTFGNSKPKFTHDISHPGLKESISTRNMTADEIARWNEGLIAHLPITPHSGWISLGYAVLIPLGLAAVVSLCVNHVEFLRTSELGKVLLQRRVAAILPSYLCRSCRQRHKNSFKKRLSTRQQDRDSLISPPTLVKSSQKCCRDEFNAYPWFINLNIGEFAFLLAVFSGLSALILLKQGMKHRLANTLGQLASTLCFLVVLPASRTSVWVLVFGIPFERAIKWHRLFGKLFIISVYLHLLVVLWRYGGSVLTSQIQWGPSRDAPYPLYGLISGIAITLIALTSFNAVRRKSYEVFYFSHLPLLMIISVSAILHAPGSEYRGPVAVAFALWAFDRVVGRCFLRTHKVVKTEVEVHKYKNLVKITTTLAKPVALDPGDYFNMYIPEIDKFENHPFTVSLQPQQNVLCFYIKSWGKAGSWVERLRKRCMISDFDATEGLRPVLEGPYGKLSIRLEDYQNFFICGGGIGVTPMISVALHLHRLASANGFKKDKLNVFVNFIWVVRDAEELLWFKDELCLLLNAKDFFRIHLYVTSKIVSLDSDDVNLVSKAPKSDGKKDSELTFNNDIKPLIRKGRPNFSALFSRDESTMGDEYGSGFYTKSAVLTCGPSNMVDNVQYAATAMGWPVHKETFLY